MNCILSKRPLFSLLASVLISYALAFFLPVKAVWVVAACGLIFAIVFAFFRKVRRFAGLVFLPSALALINFALFYHIAYQPMLRFEGKEIEIQGKIIDERVEGTTSDYFRIRPTVLFCEDESYEPMGDVIVYFEADSMSYDVGSTVSFFGTAFENDEEDFFCSVGSCNDDGHCLHCSGGKQCNGHCKQPERTRRRRYRL